jgi:hypothetical protein
MYWEGHENETEEERTIAIECWCDKCCPEEGDYDGTEVWREVCFICGKAIVDWSKSSQVTLFGEKRLLHTYPCKRVFEGKPLISKFTKVRCVK